MFGKLCLLWALVAISAIQAADKAKEDLLPEDCGKSLRVSEDSETKLGMYPWIAILQYRTKEGKIINACHGSLINKRYLVTSGHCVHPDVLANTGPLVNVVLGEHDLSNEVDCENEGNEEICANKPVVLPIEKYVHHPELDMKSSSRTFDIAVIKLASDVPSTKYVSPICLPKTEPILKSKESMLEVAGWGVNESDEEYTTKRHMSVPFVDLPTCQNAFSKFTSTLHLEDKQMCAGGNKGNNLCRGLGGGPLMQYSTLGHYDLLGVFNLGGSLCGTEGVPAVYTNVFAYRDWILQQIDA